MSHQWLPSRTSLFAPRRTCIGCTGYTDLLYTCCTYSTTFCYFDWIRFDFPMYLIIYSIIFPMYNSWFAIMLGYYLNFKMQNKIQYINGWCELLWIMFKKIFEFLTMWKKSSKGLLVPQKTQNLMMSKKNTLILAMCSACAQHDFHNKSNYIIMGGKKTCCLCQRGDLQMKTSRWNQCCGLKMLRIECCPVLVLEGHQDKEIVWPKQATDFIRAMLKEHRLKIVTSRTADFKVLNAQKDAISRL